MMTSGDGRWGGPSPLKRVRVFVQETFVSLASPTYRCYFVSQLLSNTGTWMQMVAENWLIIRLHGSGLALGISTSVQFAPMLVVGAYGGVLVDRWNKRRLLVATQSLYAILALLMAVVVASGHAAIWMVWLAGLVLGMVNVVDWPGRQAFTVEMVGATRIANATALNNMVTVSARAVGPAISGLLIATAGIGTCFVVNAISYGAVVIALLGMTPARLAKEPMALRAPGQTLRAIQAAWSQPALRAALLMVAIVGGFATNFQLLITLLAVQSLHAGAAAYGRLMAYLGIGMMAGSLRVANRPPATVLKVGAYALLLGGAYAILIPDPRDIMAWGVALLGVAAGLFLAGAAACVQMLSTPGMRGRVMGLFTVAMMGTTLVGGPVVGWISQRTTPQGGLALSAVACGAAAILALREFRLLRGRGYAGPD